MSLFGEQGNWVRTPVGTKVTVTITGDELKKVIDKPQFNLKKKDSTGLVQDVGYFFELETDKGTLTIGAWKLFYALKNAGIKKGDTITIDHKEKGVYNIEKSNQESPF